MPKQAWTLLKFNKNNSSTFSNPPPFLAFLFSLTQPSWLGQSYSLHIRLCVCVSTKHPLMEVMATSRKIMYIKFWPVIAEFKMRGLSFFFPKIEMREIQTTNFRETSGQNKYSLFWPVMAGVSLLLRFLLCKVFVSVFLSASVERQNI